LKDDTLTTYFGNCGQSRKNKKELRNSLRGTADCTLISHNTHHTTHIIHHPYHHRLQI